MDKNVGASFTLSVLAVLVFAVVLYQPDTPPSPVASVPGPPASADVAKPVVLGPISVPTRPPSEPVAAEPARPTPVETVSRRVVTPPSPSNVASPRPPAAKPRAIATAPRPASENTVAPASPRPSPPVRVTPKPTPVLRPNPEPRGPFTIVRTGESLADVAQRVYSSVESADALWKANRDLLDRRDSPLREGALLRTP